MEDVQNVQAAVSVAITKKAMDFEASMSASLINGTFEKSAEMAASLSRAAGLAAEGIGTKVNLVV